MCIDRLGINRRHGMYTIHKTRKQKSLINRSLSVLMILTAQIKISFLHESAACTYWGWMPSGKWTRWLTGKLGPCIVGGTSVRVRSIHLGSLLNHFVYPEDCTAVWSLSLEAWYIMEYMVYKYTATLLVFKMSLKVMVWKKKKCLLLISLQPQLWMLREGRKSHFLLYVLLAY